MASLLSRSYRVPLVAGSAVLASAGYYASTRQPYRLDSPGNSMPPKPTLSLPTGMLFSKQLTVTKVEQINHDTKRITFALPGGDSETSGVPASSAVLTQHTPAGAWFPVFRPYTPVHDRYEPGVLQLVVKKYPNGRASGHLHSLAPGEKLAVRGPLPGYAWKQSSQPRDVLAVAGGAGITPIYSLIKGVLSDTEDKTRISLLWGVNGPRDVVFRDEFEKLQAAFPERLQVTYFVSGAEGKSEASFGDEARWKKGYIDKSGLQDAIQRCKTGRFGDEKGTKVFFCGPPAMQEAITGRNGTLNDLGLAKKEVETLRKFWTKVTDDSRFDDWLAPRYDEEEQCIASVRDVPGRPIGVALLPERGMMGENRYEYAINNGE